MSVRCNSMGKSVLDGIPGQCVGNGWYNRDSYSSMDRSDGVPFDSDPYFDWSNVTLKECIFLNATDDHPGKFYFQGCYFLCALLRDAHKRLQ